MLKNAMMQKTLHKQWRIVHKWQKHYDVIKWKHFPRYWPFVRGIHRWPHKGQWRGALMFSLICTWINGWVNTREAGDLRRRRAHYDVTVMRTLVYYRNTVCLQGNGTWLGNHYVVGPWHLLRGCGYSFHRQDIWHYPPSHSKRISCSWCWQCQQKSPDVGH